MAKKTQFPKKWIGPFLFVELQGETLKVLFVEANKTGITKPLGCFVKRFTEAPKLEELLTTLEEKLKEWKITTVPCQVSLPMTSVLVRCVNFPSSDPEEIEGMVNFYIQDQLPYDENETICDFRLHPSPESGFSEASLFVVPQESLREALLPVQTLDLPIRNVELNLEGIYSLYSHSLQSEGIDESSTVWLMDVDHGHCDMQLVTNQSIVFARHIPMGYQHLIGNETAKENFYREIWQTVKSYDHRIIQKRPEELVLTGAREGIRMLRELLVGKLGELSLERVRDLEHPMLNDETVSETVEHTSLTALIGLSQDRLRQKLSFIPPEIKIQETIQQRGKEISKTVILAFGVVLMFCAFFAEKSYEGIATRNRLNEQIEVIQKEAQKLDTLMKETRIAQELRNPNSSVLNYLTEIHKKTAPTIALENLMITRGRSNRLSVRGLANATSEVFDFVEALQASPAFTSVETKYTTKKKSKDGSKEQVQFEIVASLMNGQKKK